MCLELYTFHNVYIKPGTLEHGTTAEQWKTKEQQNTEHQKQWWNNGTPRNNNGTPT